MALNPAARTGGQTVVGTGNGQHLAGGPGADAIVALGPNETIVGGPGRDQMGALGRNTTITGATRSDFIYGGPKATLVSGSAPDLLIDKHSDGTIRLTSDGNQVMLYGNNDHVVCSATSHNDVIYYNRSDSVNATCAANHARLYDLERGPPNTPYRLLRAAVAAPVQGTGTNDDPYVAPCDDPSHVDCIVSSFAQRRLDHFWANEFVPAYRCPADHPYLVNGNWAPVGSFYLPGVEVRESGSWSINVFIPGPGLHTGSSRQPPQWTTGTATGVGGGTATQWDGNSVYQVFLHCTSTTDHGYQVPS
jgi:hypothetical protein